MQRKRQRDYYSTNSVELGSSLMNVAPMRKLSMKRLVKWMIIVIILYVAYSIYRKTQMASSSFDDYGPVYGNDIKRQDKEVHRDNDNNDAGDVLNKRVKQQINDVFEDLKRKEEIKQKKKEENEFQDYLDELDKKAVEEVKKDKQDENLEEVRDVPDDVVQDDEDVEDNLLNDDVAEDNEIFGENDNNDDINNDGNDQDDFEPVDEQKEKEQKELEQEIEELLAEAFEDAGKEAKEEVKNNLPHQVPDQAAEQVPGVKGSEHGAGKQSGKNDGLMLQRQRAKMIYEHQREFENAVKNMGKKLNPFEIKRMNDLAIRKAIQNDDDHELPPFVTAVRQSTIKQVTQMVASIQQHLPGRKIYVYDLDLTKQQKKELMSYCGVRVRLFMASVFPKYVRNLDNMHWKPLIMQTALAEFGHITWINPQYRLGTHEVAPLVHESHEKGVLVIAQKSSYSTYAATHPDMLKFIPTDKEKLKNNPHMEIRAIMLHNTDDVHENIMKVFSACALEETCLAPEGAQWKCRFDFTGKRYADCHRYDESAINILLKNWFDYDMNQFARGNNYFRSYDPTYTPKMKKCRETRDIKDNEL